MSKALKDIFRKLLRQPWSVINLHRCLDKRNLYQTSVVVDQRGRKRKRKKEREREREMERERRREKERERKKEREKEKKRKRERERERLIESKRGRD
jgi:hypothetical protein